MAKWPKQIQRLTDEQIRVKDDFMKRWHEVLPQRYGLIERFNHGYSIKHCRPGGKVLEIGAGIGQHISYEDLAASEYFALELRPEMAKVIEQRFGQVKVIVGDCQKTIPFPDNYFDRAIAIHVLEHLPDLPAATREIRRVLKLEAEFCVMIPCEGGFAYGLARRLSAKRIFEKEYKLDYDFFIKTEHINKPCEIIDELTVCFEIQKKTFWPLLIPSVDLNLVIGMVLKPKVNS